MKSLEEATTPDQLFEAAQKEMLEALGPERCFILHGQNEYGHWTTRVSHGLEQPERVLVSGEISLQPLRHVLADGEPLMLLDATEDPEYSDRMSVAISGIRSVICVAWKDRAEQVAGLIYADDRARRSAFLDDNLAWLLRLAEVVRFRMEIIEGRAPEAPTPEPAPEPDPEPSGERSTKKSWDDHRAVARSLLKAGKVGRAERRFRLALREAKKVDGPQGIPVAKTQRSLAKVFRVQHRLEESRELLVSSAAIFARHDQDLQVARCLNTLAVGYYTDGEYEKAQTNFTKALGLWEGKNAHQRLQVSALTRLGDIGAKLKKPQEAIEFYQKAHGLSKKALGEKDPFTKKAHLRLEKLKKKAAN